MFAGANALLTAPLSRPSSDIQNLSEFGRIREQLLRSRVCLCSVLLNLPRVTSVCTSLCLHSRCVLFLNICVFFNYNCPLSWLHSCAHEAEAKLWNKVESNIQKHWMWMLTYWQHNGKHCYRKPTTVTRLHRIWKHAAKTKTKSACRRLWCYIC